MARSVSVKSRIYAPGIYGPYSVDSLTNANTTALELTIVQTTPWPDVALAATVTMKWNDESGAIFPMAGVWKNRDGTRKDTVVFPLTVPSNAVTSGTVTFDVAVTVEASLSLVAITAT